MAVGLPVNLDVPDLDAATRFYTAVFALLPGRRLGPDIVARPIDDIGTVIVRATSPAAMQEGATLDLLHGRRSTVADPSGQRPPPHPDERERP